MPTLHCVPMAVCVIQHSQLLDHIQRLWTDFNWMIIIHAGHSAVYTLTNINTVVYIQDI